MKTLIIGGGLSGLALARGLEAKGHDYLLLEARNRFGGRIKTAQYGAGYFDMGPAWFWPGQPRIAALIDRLGLEKFDQYSSGILTYEDETGQLHRGRGFSGMQGSWRLKGGLADLTQRLADDLPQARKYLGAPVKTLIRQNRNITAILDDGRRFEAQKVVLAMPPRIAAQISFEPALPDGAMQSMQGIATWMAGQAKAVAVYETPFWREAGLSGDATSRIGPMVEMHDASPSAGGPYALFGFIGIPPQGRRDAAILRQHLMAQLARLFGPLAQAPAQMFVEDWAFDPYAATTADHAPLFAHPRYGLPPAMTGLWDGNLRFAGSEVATGFGGYLEGALEAAEDVLKLY
tara:strand:- start:16511 stop:17551 length:1041 start_codon:yes stop_codon:yes gene_type:complete